MLEHPALSTAHEKPRWLGHSSALASFALVFSADGARSTLSRSLARLLACSMNMATIATALFPTRAASAPYSRSIVDDVELSADRSVTKKVSAVFQRSKVESDWAMMKYHKSELKTLEPARTQSVTLPTFNPTPTMSGPTSPRSIMQSGFDRSTPGPTPRADTSVPGACAPTMVGSILDDPDYVELVFEALIGPEALQKPSNFKDQYHGRLQAQQLMVRKRRAKQP